jgi:hypothetical protein
MNCGTEFSFVAVSFQVRLAVRSDKRVLVIRRKVLIG